MLKEMDIFVRSHLSPLRPEQVALMRARWERDKRKQKQPAALPKRRRAAKVVEPVAPVAEARPKRRRRTAAEVAAAEAEAQVEAALEAEREAVKAREALEAASLALEEEQKTISLEERAAALFKELPVTEEPRGEPPQVAAGSPTASAPRAFIPTPVRPKPVASAVPGGTVPPRPVASAAPGAIPLEEIVPFAFKELGQMVTINQRLDFDMIELIASAFGFQAVREEEYVAAAPEAEQQDQPEELKPRPPVVTVMGHVDHGKTSLLDAIREADVAASEAGGITQHIGAYKVVVNDRAVVFVDTPGHEAFTRMRARGAKVTDIVVLVVDWRELKANPDAPATGTVLESRVDKGRGPVATILVQNGTLNAGDFFICGSVFGKVRAMFDDRGRVVTDAPPSTPVEVLGLQGVPDAGDLFQVTDEAKARHVVEYRQGKQRDAAMARISGSRITLDQLHEQLKAGDVKELGIVIKADVQGSVEVLSEMLPKLSTDQVKLKIIGSGVGAVTENDVLLASASGAIVIAFGVRPDRKALDLAQQEHVDIRTHTIIYEVSDELKKAMEGLLEPVVTETYLGRAEVRNTFRVKGAGTVAGCYVVDGILKREAQVRVLRDGAVIYTSKLSSLKRFKDDASEVRTGFECGAGVANFNDIKVGDILECFTVTKISAAEAAGQGGGSAGKK